MEYRKERNFIVAYDGEKVCGKWNILTNQFIGVKGGVLKGVSPAFTLQKIEYIPNRVFRDALLLAHYNANNGNITTAQGKRLEEVISVGLRMHIDSPTWEFMATDTTKLTKEVISFIMEENSGWYSQRVIQRYNTLKKYSDFLANFTDEREKAWAEEIVNSVKQAVPIDFVKTMVVRAIHEKIRHGYSPYSMMSIINDWYTMQTNMNEPLAPAHNILTQFQILKWRYHEYQEAHYDDVLRANNDKPWLYFENEQFIVRPLLTRAEFHAEAENQRNCVERLYMSSVKDGNTHIVVVRKKSAPDDSFITCEVSNEGRINQYLYGCNRRVFPDTDEYRFQILYAEHLRTTPRG